MKIIAIVAIAVLGWSCSQTNQDVDSFMQETMEVAKAQAIQMYGFLENHPHRLPRSYESDLDSIITSGSQWWCSGFFPGVLWYLSEYHKDEALAEKAALIQQRVESEKYNTYDHDIGFQIYCSFGNAYRLTGNQEYRDVLITAANSAIQRYDESIGLIRSWDSNSHIWQYPVIIDNMINLELLMWAFHETGDSVYHNVAVSHADKTLSHGFRPDYSSYHVISYDTISGLPHAKNTHQGAHDESIWARGQAWGLYGYTMMYRETGYKRYLDLAINIASLMIDHPNMPSDFIPYWDYLSPDIPNTYRDASAAAIMASALIELSGYVGELLNEQYLSVAKSQLRTLASDQYLVEPGANGFFVLNHSVGNMNRNSEVDVPLTYADYYFVEALVRLSQKMNR